MTLSFSKDSNHFRFHKIPSIKNHHSYCYSLKFAQVNVLKKSFFFHKTLNRVIIANVELNEFIILI